MLAKTDIQLIHKFVDDGLKELKKHDLMTKAGNIPVEMRDESFDRKNEYNNWIATKSNITNSDITELEVIANIEFPNSFKTFLKYKHFYELFLPGVTDVQFFPHPIHSWNKKHKEYYSYDCNFNNNPHPDY